MRIAKWLAPALLLGAGVVPIMAQSASNDPFREGSSTLDTLRAIARMDLDTRIANALEGGPAGGSLAFALGASDPSALKKAQVGPGFQVYQLRSVSLDARQNVSSALEPTGTWRFLIQTPERTLGLMTLARVSGELRVVELGAAPMAALIAAAVRVHSREGSTLRFFRAPAAHQDFLEIRRPGFPVIFERLSVPGEPVTEGEIKALFDRRP